MFVRLDSRPRAGLEQVVELYVQRRVVGEWEDVDRDDFEDLIDDYHEARRRRRR
jgi:hypothetical protein